MRPWFRLVLAGLWLVTSSLASAAFPDKPIRWIIDVPAGTTSDLLARLVGQRVTENTGAPVIVEPRPGANGAIAYAAAASAPPDGYTIVMITTTLAQNAASKPDHRQLLQQLAPVAPIVATNSALLVRADSPIKDYAGFVEHWRSRKDNGLTFASVGNASTPHLVGEYLSRSLGLPGVHVPYTGTAPAFVDLVGGRVDFMVANIPAAMSQLKSQRLRALAVTSADRSTLLPDTPTLKELGQVGTSFHGWFGVATAAKVPADVIQRLNAEISRALQNPDVKRRIEELGAEPLALTPAQFRDYIDADVRRWSDTLQKIGIRP